MRPKWNSRYKRPSKPGRMPSATSRSTWISSWGRSRSCLAASNKRSEAALSMPTISQPAPADSPLVIVVDDDEDTRENLCDILELDGYRVETAGTAGALLARQNWDDVALVLLDRKLPDGTPEEILPRLGQRAPQAAVIIVTGYADIDGAITALRGGAADHILKPV